MRKSVVILFVMVLVSALAQGQASSKATADINTAVSCTMQVGNTIDGYTLPYASCKDIFSGEAAEVTPDNFVKVMSTTVKMSNSQSLFVSPSLVTGLYTSTRTKTTTGSSSTATAMGGVYLRAVLKDGSGNVIVAEPIKSCDDSILGCYSDANGNKGVILDTRVQTLTQELSNCVVNVTVGGVPGTGTCTFDSTIELILNTTSAHTFNFIFPNVGVGVYTLEIQAAVGAKATVGGTSAAIGAAAFGLGSVTAESVRLVHDFSF